MSKENDRALRFYNEVLGLERLHYGMWLPEDELTLAKLIEAQERYENYLIQHIPGGVKKVLDVGCGTGLLVKNLLNNGFEVDGLSPDITQKKNFTENIKAPFHHTRFDDFIVTEKYDCLIMSESAQYINPVKLFENAEKSLKEDGYLMMCDYFCFDHAVGELGKSGHNYNNFMKLIEESNFKIVTQNDVTEATAKSLDLAKLFIDRIFAAMDIGGEKMRDKYPLVSKLVVWASKKKVAKAKKQLELVDTKAFVDQKTYQFFLLQRK